MQHERTQKSLHRDPGFMTARTMYYRWAVASERRIV